MTIIATAPIPRQHRLIDADTLPLPRPARPACPGWCDQTCQDPDAVTGSTIVHGNEIGDITDSFGDGVSRVVVLVQRLDVDGKPGEATVVVEKLGLGELGPASAAALIDALTRANAIVIADRAKHAGGR